MNLKSRAQTAVVPAVFEAPTDLKRQPIEPFLQLARNQARLTRQKIQQALDKQFGPVQPPGPALPKRTMMPNAMTTPTMMGATTVEPR